MDTLDDVFELFARERRRFALYYLERQDGSVPVEELTRAVERWERGDAEVELPDDRYRDIRFTLEHRDLPKAATAEFVEYDPETKTIELTGEPREFSVILSVAEAIEQPAERSISALL